MWKMCDSKKLMNIEYIMSMSKIFWVNQQYFMYAFAIRFNRTCDKIIFVGAKPAIFRFDTFTYWTIENDRFVYGNIHQTVKNNGHER